MIVKNDIIPTDYLGALQIDERYDALKTQINELNEDNLTLWRNRRNIISDKSFNIMLENMNYDRGTFSQSISKNSEKNLERKIDLLSNSQWFKVYREAIDLTDRFKVEYKEELGLNYIVRPFSLYVQYELAKEFHKYDSLFSPEVINDIVNAFTINIIQIASKSLVLELNVSKLRNELVGETSEERFHSFVKLFTEKEKLLDFYKEYKVLTRLLSTKSIFTIKNSLQFFNDIFENRDYIYKKLNIDKEDIIENVNPGAGDSHKQGKSVIGMKFSTGKKVFYKPRSNEVGIAYHKFIDWLNNHEEILHMSTYEILNFNTFSLEEFVNKEQCNSLQEVEEFYVRFGQILAVMYLLDGTDMHMENIIAKGACPIIVDFETLLHNPIPYKFPDSAYVEAGKKANDLVSNTMLLPVEIKTNFLNKRGIDLSGLSGAEQALPYQVQAPINQNSDKMVYSMIDVTMKGAQNLPELQGEKINYTEYIDHIVQGFKQTCVNFIKYKNDLLSHQSILNEFRNLKVRIIPRGTSQYFNMISNTYHPDYLRDSLDREQVLENIWSVPYDSKEIIKSEYEDMINDDIPIFFCNVNKRDLVDSKDRTYTNIFKTDSYSKLISRISNLDMNEVNKQISVIYVKTGKYSEMIKKGNFNKNNYNITFKEIVDNKITSKYDSDFFINKAIELGDRILSSAIYSKDKETISWVSINPNSHGGFDITPSQGDFYDGLSGMIVFYYNLYKITKNNDYKDTYKKLIISAEGRVKTLDTNSAITGKLSMLYPLATLTIEENSNKYRNKFYSLLKDCEQNIDSLDYYDWIGGTTSIINIVLNVFSYTKDISLLTTCINLGNKLIKQLEEDEDKLIGGFSHGASSIAYVLIRLGTVGKIDKFKNKGIEILKFDRNLYSSTHKAWLDKTAEKNVCRYDWCHGTEGIGLSRILLSGFYTDNDIEEEIKDAMESTLNNFYKTDDCICHGNMGTTELYLSAFEKYNESSYYKLAQEIAYFTIKEAEKRGQYQTRSLSGFPSIGLYTGLAGIGNQLLRVAKPNNIRSILSLS